MKKIWLSLMGFTVVATTSLTTISCATQPLGWNGAQQYWMILDYQGFYDWMANVDLISQEEWDSELTDSQKEQSWKTLTNVGLNNFMSIMNLTYLYLVKNNDQEKAEPWGIDQLGGFYNNFGYAILDQEDSFASHLLKLKKDDQQLISDWESLTENNYLTNFKNNKLNNKFHFHPKEEKPLPIKMSITAGNSQRPANYQIVKIWKPIYDAIQNQKGNDDLIQELWTELKNWYSEAFIFSFNLYWPVEEEGKPLWQISFNINLTFDV